MQCLRYPSLEKFQEFVGGNTPVVVKNCPHNDSEWTLEALNNLLGDETLSNVFVSNKGRFLYFKQNERQKCEQEGLARAKMTFREFLERATKSNHEPILCEDEKYYLYGEPLPECLKPQVHIPEFLKDPSLQENDSKDSEQALTSSLLWVAATGNCSPLHYDMSEGIIHQVHGSKTFILAPPTHYNSLHPYPIDSPHDRQSQINDIHDPSEEFRTSLEEVDFLKGEINAGDILYIPYGWWHQIESEGISVSVTHRWNPYKEHIKTAAVSLAGVNKLVPENVAHLLYENILGNLALPTHVTDILSKRHSHKLVTDV